MMGDTVELIEETKEYTKKLNKRISWIGSADGKLAISKEDFFALKPVEYDSGFGGQEIAKDLIVVFTDGSWLERYEYDGSECWEYNESPIKKKDAEKFSKVKGNGWETLMEINTQTEEDE